VEKVQILEGPEKGYCEAVVKLFLPGWLWNLYPWEGKLSTFDYIVLILLVTKLPGFRSIWGRFRKGILRGCYETFWF